MRKQWFAFATAAVFSVGLAMAMPQEQAPGSEAGRPAHRQMDPNRQVKMLTKRLNLTEDQQKQLLPILSDRQQQFENIRNDSSLAPADRREKMRAARQDSETKLKAILTDSQKQTYDQMQQNMREHMQERRNHADPGTGSGNQ